MVHFCKLCQLLHKSMDFIECDESNVWLLEAVFKLKIVPVNGRVEPICQKCIAKYNKVIKRKRKANGGFPISQSQIFPITTTTVTSSTQLVISGPMMNEVMQRQLSQQEQQSSQMSLATAAQLREEDSSTETSIVTANSFQLNITGAAAVYRTAGKDGRSSSDDESSVEIVSDVEDDEEDEGDGAESSGSSDCCSEDSDESSYSYSSSSSSGSSSITQGSLAGDDKQELENVAESESLSSFMERDERETSCQLESIVELKDTVLMEQARATVEQHKKSKKKRSKEAGSAQHVCEVCEKSFKKAIYLKVHMRTHTGEKPFACDICFKSFTQASSLNTHKRLHSNIKPFVCQVCGAEYTSSGNYRVHLRTHTLEKPYKCSYFSRQPPYTALRWRNPVRPLVEVVVTVIVVTEQPDSVRSVSDRTTIRPSVRPSDEAGWVLLSY
ncbi:myoneurin [Aedes albopictus]|uniref:C2H2-type domain-containing protein n=1 Tax=Aedes albopictus TaxID=7160 RepID=A0ABM1Z0H1_AEDAL